MTYYFAYGSNMDFRQLKNRGCPKVEFLGPAKLSNYRLVFSGSSPNWSMQATANIIESQGEAVWGGLFSVDEKCLLQLDIFEHVPVRRKRIGIRVICELHEYNAITYVLIDDNRTNQPSEEYMQKVISGANDCKLPSWYINKISKLKTTL